jgi:hypothetical protein
MQIRPLSALKPVFPTKLSLFSSSYTPIHAQPQFPLFALHSTPNSPLFLLVKSADSKLAHSYLFSAGEPFRQLALHSSFPTLPKISKFDLSDNNFPENNESVVIQISNKAQCRICLEYENEELMISPCLCNGTQKYVHEGCLKIWLLKSEKSEVELSLCEVCKGKLNMRFVYVKNCRVCSENSCRFWLPMLVAIIILFVLACFMLGSFLGNNVDKTAQVVIYVILGMMAVISMAVSLAFVRDLCSEAEVSEWEILNYQIENTNIQV